MAEILKLHPKSYKELKGRLIFYVDNSRIDKNVYEKVKSDLLRARTLVVTGTQKSGTEEWKYQFYVGEYCFYVSKSNTKNFNFYMSDVLMGEDAKGRIRQLYKKRIFTIIPSGGIFLIYNNQLEPAPTIPLGGGAASVDWSMEVPVYNQLVEQMDDYFEDEDDEDLLTRSTQNQVTPRFHAHVIKPFRDFTDKEDWVEERKQLRGDGAIYRGREYVRSTDKGSVYRFFVDADAVQDDEGNVLFKEGDRITIVSPENERQELCTGVVESLDELPPSAEDGTEDAGRMGLSVAFFRQMNDSDILPSAKIVMAVNNTQTKVRTKVIKKLMSGRAESAYMYRTFKDFSVDGYVQPEEDLKHFLAEKMCGKYPPNQMQMEAIIKGILTKDLLLVLGPPGTGKTTVISQWVEYFISKGKRVLISSQNNAAVDNVLARFDGKGEIVRLGNENKVQEECKKFLPHNKLETMWTNFRTNRDRVQAQYHHDSSALEQYIGLIEEYIDWQKQYDRLQADLRQKTVDFDLAKKRENTCLAQITQLVQAIEQIEPNRMEYQETAAALKIFLDQLDKKPRLVRWFQRRYARHAAEQRANVLRKEGALNGQREKYTADLTSRQEELDAARHDLTQREHALEQCTRENEQLEKRRPLMANTLLSHIPFESDFCRKYAPAGLSRITLPALTAELEQARAFQKRLAQVRAALEDWYGTVANDRNDILQSLLLEECQVVGATCIGINSNRDFANVTFDVSIVDESGQIQIHNALVPMSRAPKNLLLGDYKQIPPVANEDVVKVCREDGIDTTLLHTSFFEYLFENMRSAELKRLEKENKDKSALLKPVLDDYIPRSGQTISPEQVQDMIDKVTQDRKKTVNLNSQFRMPGVISDVISEWFYESNYFSSYDMKRFAPLVPGTDMPMIVVSTSAEKGREDQPGENGGYCNPCEAELVAEIVAQVINGVPEEKRETFCRNIGGQIGIISAYSAQVRKIRECLRRRNLGISAVQINSMVNSLDSFQGQERPLILYSLTRSSQKLPPERARVGFMKELRRLNVAFTRCQQQLVILGDIDYLSKCMYTEKQEDFVPPCGTIEHDGPVSLREIEQCAGCAASCERKFSRFMRLLIQHVEQGDGQSFRADFFLKKRTEGSERLGVSCGDLSAEDI